MNDNAPTFSADVMHEILYRGTAHLPYQLPRAVAAEIREWVEPLEKELAALPYLDQQAFINKHRAVAMKRWPWWKPGIVVEIVP